MTQNPDISAANSEDIRDLQALGNSHEAGYFERCFEEQAAGKRLLFKVRQPDGRLGGYVILNWHPRYQPFRRLNIPEIQDLFVAPDVRRQGIGEALVRECERHALARGCTQMGIAVGLHAGFGAAQRLYVRLGYVPDGAGVMYDRDAVHMGDMRIIDDDLTLMLVKDI